MSTAATPGLAPADIDRAEVRRCIEALFHAYEDALMRNDVEALLDFFWADPRLTRYGIADRQLGHDEMVRFRRACPAPNFSRRLENLRIHSFGPDCAVAQVEFVRSDTALRGFQTQTWVQMAAGWKIVSAHVSMVPWPPGP